MNWEKAKRILTGMNFPEDYENFKETHVSEYHEAGKKKHPLKTYTRELPRILGFRCLAKYSICELCASKRVRTQRLVITSNEQNAAFMNWFIRKGEIVAN